MTAYKVTVAIAEKVVSILPSRYFSANKKTVISVDFGICGLMQKTATGGYTSKTCKGCYSAIALTQRKPLREKIENLPPTSDQELEKFEESLKMLKAFVPGLKRLRFYAFADFKGDHVPFIKVAARYFEVDLISKALTFPQNSLHLMELMKVDNVWISLSFNKDFMANFDRTVALVKSEGAERVTLNYTINYTEENPDSLPFRNMISVWHLKNDRRRHVLDQDTFETFKETNVCGVFNGDGGRTEWTVKNNRVQDEAGSCHSCNNCRCSLKMLQAGISGSLPEALSA